MRHSWKFQIQVKDLIPATKAKIKEHEERERFWDNELDKAEAELRSKGIEFREQAVSGGKKLVSMQLICAASSAATRQ